ncbi:MAG: hypothetical protein AABY15_02410 [Nanoarchaeota archaeon]
MEKINYHLNTARVKHYPDRQLSVLRFSRLGALCMTAFGMSDSCPENIIELGRIEKEMKRRPLEERLELLQKRITTYLFP